jgi:hypothetical protein
MSNKNTKWFSWEKRNTIPNRNQPAIYYIAYIDKNIEGQAFNYIEEIVYIGMTISKNGLKGRLDQFQKAMFGSEGVHGGAERVRFKYKNAKSFFDNAYVSACIFEISKNRNTADDWRIKGDCVGHEYKSFADYIDKYKKLPEFNDQKKSKKK